MNPFGYKDTADSTTTLPSGAIGIVVFFNSMQ